MKYVIYVKYRFELQHEKTNHVDVAYENTQISLGNRSVGSESERKRWSFLPTLCTMKTDPTGLIWVFAWASLILSAQISTNMWMEPIESH